MTATNSVGRRKAASASDKPRVMRLMPVVLPQQPAWNERVARWAHAS